MPPTSSRTLAGSGSLSAMAALLGGSVLASCREATPPEIPPVTAALAPPPQRGPELASAPFADAGSLAAPLREAPVTASFVDVPGTLDAPRCSRLMLAVAKGKLSALGETLTVGDVLVVTYPESLKLEGAGLAVVARRGPPRGHGRGRRAHPRGVLGDPRRGRGKRLAHH